MDKAWLEDGYKFQMDYVLDTTVRIGSEPYAYVTFESKAR